MEIFLIFIVCIFATTVGAISGVGGGVIMKPVIDAVSSMTAETISFMTGCTVLAMSTVSLAKSRQVMQRYEKRKAPWLALGAVPGGLIGKWLFNLLKASVSDGRSISLTQNIFMLLLTLAVYLYMLFRGKIRTHRIDSATISVCVGLVLGLLSSFLGIGGGPINLVVLYFFFSLETKEAAWNSIFIILFSQLASFISSLLSGVPSFDPVLLALMLVGGIGGGFLGSAFSKKMDNKAVDKLFMAVILLIVVISIYNIYKFAS